MWTQRIGIVAGLVALAVMYVPLSHAQGTKNTGQQDLGFREFAEWARANGDPPTPLPAATLRALGLPGGADASARGVAYQDRTESSRRFAFMVATINGQIESMLYYESFGQVTLWHVAGDDNVLSMARAPAHGSFSQVPKNQFPTKCQAGGGDCQRAKSYLAIKYRAFVDEKAKQPKPPE